MANASSRARAVYKQNTAVLYYEPTDSEATPVSTARILSVGAANAASGGGTLQLIGGLVDAGDRQADADGRRDVAVEQPQIVEVEPPRAAPRKRPAQKRPTRVIAYNVRIVARGDEQVTYDGARFEAEAATSRMEMPQEPPFVMPNHSHRHREMHVEVPPRADTYERAQPMHGNAQPQQEPQFRMPQRGPQGPGFDMPRDARFEVPDQRGARERMSYEMPEGAAHGMPRPGRPMAGSIPMSLFGALENMGGMLHEQTRRVADASNAAGSYKQLLKQHIDAGRGGLLSTRNMCIAVGAYALILFLLAVFTS
jgi:hypothetical protein